MAKDVYEFNEISQGHPLLQTQQLNEVLTYWPQRRNDYLLAQRMPVVEEDTDKIQVDLRKQQRGGMTPAVSMHAESPIHKPGHGRGRREFEPATFREKTVLVTDDLYDLRQIGTYDEYVDARAVLRQRMADLEIRLLNRLEFMRRQVLFDNQVSYTVADTGIDETVQYPHPSYLDPTASTLWSNHSSADPIVQLQNMIDDYELDTGRMVNDIIFPHRLMQDLIQVQRFRDLAKQNLRSFNGSANQIRNLFIDILGVGAIQISKDWLYFQTEATSSVASGQATADLGNVSQLSADMNVFFVDEHAEVREKKTVSSISGNTVTFDTNFNNSFSAGAPVKYKLPTIPEDRILMFGSFDGPMSTEGRLADDEPADDPGPNDWGEIVSTRSHYADLEDPDPGMYTRSIDNTDQDPPSIEQILGLRGLARVTQNEAWATFTVL